MRIAKRPEIEKETERDARERVPFSILYMFDERPIDAVDS